MKSKTAILIVVLLILSLSCNLFAGGYAGFNELNDKECEVLGDNDIQKLPQSWHKYKGFIKICGLKKSNTEKPQILLISIWAFDYLESSNLDMWEEFPLPVIVDDQWNQVGSFPELYPANLASDSYVFYGKWKAGIPREIRIDVENPSVTGDYYYAPLRWNPKAKRYIMKDTEERYGKRPR